MSSFLAGPGIGLIIYTRIQVLKWYLKPVLGLLYNNPFITNEVSNNLFTFCYKILLFNIKTALFLNCYKCVKFFFVGARFGPNKHLQKST